MQTDFFMLLENIEWTLTLEYTILLWASSVQFCVNLFKRDYNYKIDSYDLL